MQGLRNLQALQPQLLSFSTKQRLRLPIMYRRLGRGGCPVIATTAGTIIIITIIITITIIIIINNRTVTNMVTTPTLITTAANIMVTSITIIRFVLILLLSIF